MAVDLIDDLTVVNKALIKIAEAPIDSLENAESRTARTLKMLLPQAKRFVFRQHPWNCLRARAILTASADKPIFGYTYKYALPADCLRPLAIQDDRGSYIPFYEASYGGTLPGDKQFTVEGQYIMTDVAPNNYNKTSNNQIGLNFVYTKNPDNLNILDSNVVELLSYYLAIESAYTFSGSVSLKQQLIAEQKECLKVARACNAQEVAPGIPIGAVLGAHW